MGIRKGWRYYQCKKLITSAKIWGLIGCAEILLEVWEPSYVHYIAYIGPFLLIGLMILLESFPLFLSVDTLFEDRGDPLRSLMISSR